MTKQKILKYNCPIFAGLRQYKPLTNDLDVICFCITYNRRMFNRWLLLNNKMN